MMTFGEESHDVGGEAMGIVYVLILIDLLEIDMARIMAPNVSTQF